MADHFNLATRNTTRVAVSSAAPTTWTNDADDTIKVRVVADLNVHVRVIRSDDDEADDDDFMLVDGSDITLDINHYEHLSFLGYAEVSGSKEEGTIAFALPASGAADPTPADAVPDTVIIDDGVKPPVTFTFGDGTGGTLDPGVTAAASAEALRAAIQAKIDSNDLDISVMRFGSTLLLVNDNYVDGAITIGVGDADGDTVVDEGDRISRVDFTGGASPGSPPVHTGSAWVTQV